MPQLSNMKRQRQNYSSHVCRKDPGADKCHCVSLRSSPPTTCKQNGQRDGQNSTVYGTDLHQKIFTLDSFFMYVNDFCEKLPLFMFSKEKMLWKRCLRCCMCTFHSSHSSLRPNMRKVEGNKGSVCNSEHLEKQEELTERRCTWLTGCYAAVLSWSYLTLTAD